MEFGFQFSCNIMSLASLFISKWITAKYQPESQIKSQTNDTQNYNHLFIY